MTGKDQNEQSIGNVVEPQKVVNQFGADVLRLWAASVDYTNDVRISDNIVQQLVEVFRKVRNSIRFMLGNLYDFDPAKHSVEYEKLNEIDQYALHKLNELVEKVHRHLRATNTTKITNFCRILRQLT